MSVQPWMLACPRRARMPPGRPMLPSSSWMIAPARMYSRPRCAGSSPRCRRARRCGPAGCAGPGRADGQELLPGRAADVLDELRGVAGEVPLQDLEHAAGAPAWGPGRCRWSPRPAARRRPRRRAPAPRRTARRGPRAPAVSRRTRTASCSGRSSRSPDRSRRTALQVLGVLVALVDQERGIGVGHDVLAEVLLLGEDVVDHAAEEGDVTSTGSARRRRPARWSG